MDAGDCALVGVQARLQARVQGAASSHTGCRPPASADCKNSAFRMVFPLDQFSRAIRRPRASSRPPVARVQPCGRPGSNMRILFTRATPWVLQPVPVSDTAKPALRAKSPPSVMGAISTSPRVCSTPSSSGPAPAACRAAHGQWPGPAARLRCRLGRKSPLENLAAHGLRHIPQRQVGRRRRLQVALRDHVGQVELAFGRHDAQTLKSPCTRCRPASPKRCAVCGFGR